MFRGGRMEFPRLSESCGTNRPKRGEDPIPWHLELCSQNEAIRTFKCPGIVAKTSHARSGYLSKLGRARY